jgi:16S rRNA (adenine1518-N6/adenine1519-N6)-dimethyltransferase
MGSSDRVQPGAGSSVRPRKGLGQHFLVDPAHREKIVAAALLSAADAVLEIGPGRGEMTELIADRAGQVVAVELDDRLIPMLHNRFRQRAAVRVIHGDILAADVGRLMTEFGAVPYKVIANLPYYITGAVIRQLLESHPAPEMLVLTVQEEVAERMVALPPRMNLLATSVQYFTRAALVHRIPASAFYPVPKVDSAVVRLEQICSPNAPDVSDGLFFDAVRAGYSRPRKKLRNSLAIGLGVPPAQAQKLLDEAGIDPDRRPETLSIPEWTEVARQIGKTGS